MNPNQRREGFLNDPREPRLRAVPPRLGQRRHVMDHIAERGGLDEQDVGHLAGGLSAGANACIRVQADVHDSAHSNAKRHERASRMTVLVTGGAGYLGSHMVHALLDAGERVVVLDDLSTGCDWALPQGARLVIGDAGNQALVARLIAEHRIEAILHFAASVVVPDSVRDPLGYYRNNTVNSRALIETAVTGGVR